MGKLLHWTAADKENLHAFNKGKVEKGKIIIMGNDNRKF